MQSARAAQPVFLTRITSRAEAQRPQRKEPEAEKMSSVLKTDCLTPCSSHDRGYALCFSPHSLLFALSGSLWSSELSSSVQQQNRKYHSPFGLSAQESVPAPVLCGRRSLCIRVQTLLSWRRLVSPKGQTVIASGSRIWYCWSMRRWRIYRRRTDGEAWL